MPIIGTTTRNTPIETNRIGKVWKGEKKQANRAGKDLMDRFRLDLPEPYSAMARAAYGTNEPKMLRVFFPHDTTDQVFETWNDAFTAQGLKHRCNGERIVREVGLATAYKNGKEYQKRIRKDCDRPCQKAEGEVICKECTSTGYLSFIVRELFAMAGMSQVIAQTVTGINDVVGVWNQLRAFEQKYGGLRNSPVPSPSTWGHIPFVLQRVPKEISRPIYDGQKKAYTGGYTRGMAYPIVITEDPQWLEHWQNVTRRQHILQMVQSGQAALLMAEDRAILQEMQSISLPGFTQPELPQLQPQPNATQPALQPSQEAPEYESIDTEQLADEMALDPAQERAEELIGRGPKVRIGSVNSVFKFEVEELKAIVDSVNSEGLTDDERAEAILFQMFVAFGKSRKMNPENTRALIEKIREQLPYAVDEDLAQIFVAESLGREDPQPKEKATTFNGVSID